MCSTRIFRLYVRAPSSSTVVGIVGLSGVSPSASEITGACPGSQGTLAGHFRQWGKRSPPAKMHGCQEPSSRLIFLPMRQLVFTALDSRPGYRRIMDSPSHALFHGLHCKYSRNILMGNRACQNLISKMLRRFPEVGFHLDDHTCHWPYAACFLSKNGCPASLRCALPRQGKSLWYSTSDGATIRGQLPHDLVIGDAGTNPFHNDFPDAAPNTCR